MSQSIVVTGVTGGIGKEICARLVKSGHRIFGLSRNSDKLQSVAQELGEKFRPILCDLRNREQIVNSAQQILSIANRVDCLINNAAVLRMDEAHRVAESDLDEQIDVLFKAPFLLTNAFIPGMIHQGSGLIINMGCVAGTRASPKMSVYAAAKAALISMTKSLALEYAERGIRVVSISPGTVQTNLMDKIMLAMIQKRVPLKRLAQPAEVAALVEYLLSPEASYITGENIILDGGISI